MILIWNFLFGFSEFEEELTNSDAANPEAINELKKALSRHVTPQKFHVTEKFRFRLDKMITRETFLLEDRIIERFVNGRKDRLSEHEFYKVGATIMGGKWKVSRNVKIGWSGHVC